MKKSVLGIYSLQILNVFFSFFMSIALARLLGANERGLLVIFITSSGFISTVMEFCLGSAITYFIASSKFEINKTLTTIIYWTFVTLLLIILVTLISPLLNLQQFIYGQNYVNLPLKIYFIIIVTLTVFNSLLSAIFFGVKDFKLINYLTLGSLVLSAIFYFIFLGLNDFYNYKYTSIHIIFITTLVLFIRSVALVFFYYKKISIKPSKYLLYKNDIKSLFALSLINYTSNIVQFLTYKMDFWFVNYYNGPKVLGIYSLAVNLAQLFWMLPNSVGTVLFPTTASLDSEKALQYTKMLCRIVFTITLLLGVIGGGIFAYFIPYIYGIQFSSSAKLFLILLLGVLPFSIKIIIASYYGGIKKTKIDMMGSVIAFLVCLILDFILIPKYGAIGAATASVFAYFCNTLFMIVTFNDITGASFSSFLVIKRSDIRLILNYLPFKKNKN